MPTFLQMLFIRSSVYARGNDFAFPVNSQQSIEFNGAAYIYTWISTQLHPSWSASGRIPVHSYLSLNNHVGSISENPILTSQASRLRESTNAVAEDFAGYDPSQKASEPSCQAWSALSIGKHQYQQCMPYYRAISYPCSTHKNGTGLYHPKEYGFVWNVVRTTR